MDSIQCLFVSIFSLGYDRPSLRDLHNHVIPAVASKWRDLGVQLLNPSTSDNILEIIKENHPQDVMGCCKYMLQKWLDTIPDASWNQLLEALRSPCVQLNFLADQVECKLIKKCKSPGVDPGFFKRRVSKLGEG